MHNLPVGKSRAWPAISKMQLGSVLDCRACTRSRSSNPEVSGPNPGARLGEPDGWRHGGHVGVASQPDGRRRWCQDSEPREEDPGVRRTAKQGIPVHRSLAESSWASSGAPLREGPRNRLRELSVQPCYRTSSRGCRMTSGSFRARSGSCELPGHDLSLRASRRRRRTPAITRARRDPARKMSSGFFRASCGRTRADESPRTSSESLKASSGNPSVVFEGRHGADQQPAGCQEGQVQRRR